MEQTQTISSLAHHGVDGMKWGVWNEETRLKYLGTPPKYGDDPKFDMLVESSQGDIEEFYESGKITGWTSKSGMRYYNDIPTERLTLGTDTTFTTYGSADKNLDGPLWTTWKDDAASTYRNFGDTKYELSPKRDFKVASMKDSYDTFTDLFSDDGDQGQSFRSSVYEQKLGPLGQDKDRVSAYASAAREYGEAAASTCYRSFVHTQYKQTDATKSFFKRMESDGFDGILDQNDIDDYTKQSPVIVLNPSESLELKNSAKHSEMEMRSMETNAIKRGEQHLSHYGVKGMKWGVWNAETRAKYAGGIGRASNTMKAKLSSAGGSITKGSRAAAKMVGRKASSLASSAKASTTKKIEAKKAAKAEKIANRKDIAQQRKELGMTRKQYDRLRERTLKSHDPRVVEKGMRTLTDEELNKKLIRLQTEEKISRMSTDLASRKAQAAAARNDAISRNPLVKMGSAYVSKYVNGRIDQALKSKDATVQLQKSLDELQEKYSDLEGKNRGLKSKLEETKAQANQRNNSTPRSQYVQNPVYSAPKYTSSTSQPHSSNTANPSQSGLPGSVSSSASTSSSQKASSKGKSYVNDYVDVKPSSSSSTVSSGKKWYDINGKTVYDTSSGETYTYNGTHPFDKKKKNKDDE